MKAAPLDAMVNDSLLRSPGGGKWPEQALPIIAPARLRNGYGFVKACLLLAWSGRRCAIGPAAPHSHRQPPFEPAGRFRVPSPLLLPPLPLASLGHRGYLPPTPPCLPV